jgi:TolB-like protein
VEYFAEGMTEDLTTDLSRIPGSFVIAPQTAFAYKGSPVDVRQIGRELSVRYVLQGSVRRITDSLRSNAQLVEAANASQLWAERFDGQVTELAKVQDQVTQRIASALNVALVDAESQRAQRERPNNPDAVDLTMRGMALINKPASRKSMQRARELFEEALRLGPDYLPALNGLANVMLIEWGSTWYNGTSEEHLRAMERVVNRALAIKPDALRKWMPVRLPPGRARLATPQPDRIFGDTEHNGDCCSQVETLRRLRHGGAHSDRTGRRQRRGAGHNRQRQGWFKGRKRITSSAVMSVLVGRSGTRCVPLFRGCSPKPAPVLDQPRRYDRTIRVTTFCR